MKLKKIDNMISLTKHITIVAVVTTIIKIKRINVHLYTEHMLYNYMIIPLITF